MIDLDDFVRGYVECGLFCTSADIAGAGDEGDDRSLSDLGYTFDDLSADSLAAIRTDLERFAEANSADLETYCELKGDWIGQDTFRGSDARYSATEIAGHDLWYSRGGHGTGFWDQYKNGLEEIGRRLDKAAGLTEPYLYVGADGKVYL